MWSASIPIARNACHSAGSASADRNVSPLRVTNDSGYAVNHTDARSTAARGSGCANGFCHMLPWPESCDASRFASPSIDCSTSHSTYSRLSAIGVAAEPVGDAAAQRAPRGRPEAPRASRVELLVVGDLGRVVLAVDVHVVRC